MEQATYILGIDPGLASLGWGIIRVNQANSNSAKFSHTLEHVAHGVIKTPSSEEISRRLLYIEQSIEAIFSRYNTISILAYERQFFVKNVTSGLQVAQALGVILLYAAKQGLIVESFTPREIKLQVTGAASAKKDTVETFLCRLLGIDTLDENHASDALGAAVSYFYKKHSIV